MSLPRAQFAALKDRCYFNYGAQGPMADGTIGAIAKACAEQQSAGPFGTEGILLQQYVQARTRRQVAQLLGTTAERIAFTESISVACNIVLWGMDWRAGDRIVLTDAEVPGVRAAVAELSRRFSLRVDVICAERLQTVAGMQALAQSFAEHCPRLLIVSHVHWGTGAVLPIEGLVALAREAGGASRPLILVDGAQAAGNIALDVTQLEVDFYAFTGSKWCCGPEGVSGLFVSTDAISDIHPTFIGWRGLDIHAGTQSEPWWPDARRFEIATTPNFAYEGLRHALALQQGWGSIGERCAARDRLAHELWHALRTLEAQGRLRCLSDRPPQAGILSFTTDGPPGTLNLMSALEEKGILAKHMHDQNCLRLCLHYLSTQTEVDHLLEALHDLLPLPHG